MMTASSQTYAAKMPRGLTSSQRIAWSEVAVRGTVRLDELCNVLAGRPGFRRDHPVARIDELRRKGEIDFAEGWLWIAR